VALANGHVQLYFNRGCPLPVRRSFVLYTVRDFHPGARDVLKVPIVQGEFRVAHLCRLVGTLEIPSVILDKPVPVGTEVELTIEPTAAVSCGRRRASPASIGIRPGSAVRACIARGARRSAWQRLRLRAHVRRLRRQPAIPTIVGKAAAAVGRAAESQLSRRASGGRSTRRVTAHASCRGDPIDAGDARLRPAT